MPFASRATITDASRTASPWGASVMAVGVGAYADGQVANGDESYCQPCSLRRSMPFR